MKEFDYYDDDITLDDVITPEIIEDEDPDGLIGVIPDNSLDETEPEESSGLIPYEVELTKSYDEITRSDDIELAVSLVVAANPQHSNGNTIDKIVMGILHKQGKSRMQNSYSTGLLRGYEVDSVLEEDDNGEFNEKVTEAYRDLVSRFIESLATADLSNDNAANKRRKQRRLPAFLIFLFSNNMYNFVLNCPTLPDDYKMQVNDALRRINDTKYELVEELAQKYEAAGRDEVAKRVRQLQLAWFEKEPAEILNAAEYRDLNLTVDDVNIYKSIRSKYTNTSTSITQEVASELIEVVIDPEAGISEKLKDKVRAEAINDVKKQFREFAENSEEDNRIAIEILHH